MRVAFRSDWAHNLRWSPWRLPKMLWGETRCFVQRGWRGYSDLEVWGGLDYFLCDVLPDALRDSARQRTPAGFTAAQWQRRIECMATGLEAARDVINRAETFEQEERLVRRFRRGWLLMGKWFWWL